MTKKQKSLLDEGFLNLKANKDVFDKYQDIQIEIGFGDGKYLVYQALNQSKTCFIGCEPFLNGVAKLLNTLNQLKIENVRIFVGDCRAFITEIPTESVSCVYMLFPDPWPKNKHIKRRLFQKEFLDSIARITKANGSFRFASDIEDYAKQVFNLIGKNDCFHPKKQDLNSCIYDNNPWSEVTTKYEKKAKLAGRPRFFIEALKCHRLD